MEVPPGTPAEQQALQVLMLAQRTAEDQLATARQQADQIIGEARENAAQIVQDAQAHADERQREGEQALSEAHASAAQIARDAQSNGDQVQQQAEQTLSDSRMRADEIVKDAQSKADELQHLAQQRYEDVVGSLAAKREGLQQQIEALERFDREYRARLQAFMQNQLRALWVDEPRLDPEDLERPDGPPAVGSVPAPRESSDQPAAHPSPDS